MWTLAVKAGGSSQGDIWRHRRYDFVTFDWVRLAASIILSLPLSLFGKCFWNFGACLTNKNTISKLIQATFIHSFIHLIYCLTSRLDRWLSVWFMMFYRYKCQTVRNWNNKDWSLWPSSIRHNEREPGVLAELWYGSYGHSKVPWGSSADGIAPCKVRLLTCVHKFGAFF